MTVGPQLLRTTPILLIEYEVKRVFTWSLHPYVLVSLVQQGTLQATKRKPKHQLPDKPLSYTLSCLQDMLGQCDIELVGEANQYLI